jgi:hypothetical protein
MSIVDSKYNNELELVKLSMSVKLVIVQRWGASHIQRLLLPLGWMYLVAAGKGGHPLALIRVRSSCPGGVGARFVLPLGSSRLSLVYLNVCKFFGGAQFFFKI